MQAKLITRLVISSFFVATTVFVTGCVQKGPVQRAGEQIDQAVENLQDAVDPPGPAQKAGRSIDRALENATQ